MNGRTLIADSRDVTHKRDGKSAHWHRNTAATYAGRAYTRAGRAGDIADAHGVHPSRGSRYGSGDVYSLLTKAFFPLARHPETDHYPAISEAKILMARDTLEDRTPAELRQRLMQIDYETTQVAADLMRHAYEKGVDAERRSLHAKLADLSEEAAGICDVLLGDNDG